MDDPDGLRATLDEGSSSGDVNLLVDALWFGSMDRLKALLDQRAEPYTATADVAPALAQRRGDAESAHCQATSFVDEAQPAQRCAHCDHGLGRPLTLQMGRRRLVVTKQPRSALVMRDRSANDFRRRQVSRPEPTKGQPMYAPLSASQPIGDRRTSLHFYRAS